MFVFKNNRFEILQTQNDLTKRGKLQKRMCSIIILNWNSCELLKRCLKLIKINTSRHHEIIIIDNGSNKDDSIEFLNTIKNEVKIIYNKENRGFAPAVNQGILMTDGSDICLMNVDAEPQAGWLEHLYETMMIPNAGMVGPLGNEVASGHQRVGYVNQDSITPNLHGFCLLILRELINKIGLFDENYKIGGYEDSVTGDMPIIIKRKGKIEVIPIEDLYSDTKDGWIAIKNTKIWSNNGWSKINYCYKHTVDKKIYRIVTRMGLIHVTGDHSLFSNGKPMLVKDIKVGDKIDLYPLPKSKSKIKVNANEAWCDGLFVAEGTANIYTYTRQTLYVAKIDLYYDDSLIDKFIKIMGWKKYCLIYKKIKPYYRAILRTKESINLIISKFYSCKRHKKIPISILNASIKSKKEFLEGFLDGDGHRATICNRKYRSYSNKSMAVNLGLQLLLEELGIKATINYRKDKTDINLREIYGCLGSNQHKKVISEPIPDDGTVVDLQDVTNFYKEDENDKIEVYDVNTDNSTFVCGLGGIIAHNTDYSIRTKLAGYETYISAKSLVIHKAHQVYDLNGIDHYKNDDINREIYLNKFFGVLLQYAKIYNLYEHTDVAKKLGIICCMNHIKLQN